MSPNPALLTVPHNSVAAGLPFEFVTSTGSTAGSVTTHTFSSVPFGDAAASRTVIVGVSSQAPVSAVTVGGVTAIQDKVGFGASSTRAAVFSATVPTGSTGNVVVTLSSSTPRCAIGVWRCSGAVTVPTSGAGTTGATVSMNAGDFAVACNYSTTTEMWTNATSRYRALFSTSDAGAGADRLAASTGSVTISATSSLVTAIAVYRAA